MDKCMDRKFDLSQTINGTKSKEINLILWLYRDKIENKFKWYENIRKSTLACIALAMEGCGGWGGRLDQSELSWGGGHVTAGFRQS